MNKFILNSFRRLGYLLMSILVGVIIYLNFRLYYSPIYTVENDFVINESVLNQLHYLKDYLHKDGGKAAQAKYPEGFVFVNALYGLTWADFIRTIPTTHPHYQEGLQEIDWAYQALDSDYGAMWFPAKLNPSRGIFYVGWKNYLLAKKLEHQQTTTDSLLFVQQCDLIYQAYQAATEQTYLESYIEAVWPADNLVAIASLAAHDKLYTPKYTDFVHAWLKKVQQKLDPASGLIPHEVVYKTDATLEGAKGSSQSLMLAFLLEIDTTFAKQQFELYHKKFLNYRFGLPGIREYPKGVVGEEDVDSGPVLLEIGGAASLVGQRTMALYGDIETAVGLRNSIESFGVAYTSSNQKIYVLGLEPIADAFIAWSNVVDIHQQEKLIGNWRWSFQLLSLGLLLLIVLVWKRLRKKTVSKSV